MHAFDFPPNVKGQKSQPEQDHYFTTIKSLFNPLQGSFFPCDPEATNLSPLDLRRETSNKARISQHGFIRLFLALDAFLMKM